MKKNLQSPVPEEENIRFVSRFYREGKADTSAAWKRVTEAIRPQPVRKRRLPLYRIGIAATILVCLMAGTIYYHISQKSKTDWIVVATQADKQEIVLPDQSTITLAPASSIRYDRLAFGRKERRVALSGKAFFSVSRLPNVPFRVNTALADIQVLGTQFQVVAAPDSTVTWVASGKVRFSTPRQHADLTSNMRAVVNRQDGQIRMRAKDRLNELAWKTQRLVYKNTPLREVAADLEALYQVELQGMPTQELRLTATFDQMNISDILYIINQTLDTNLTTLQQ